MADLELKNVAEFPYTSVLNTGFSSVKWNINLLFLKLLKGK
jgi:hypothetical protein